MSAIWEVKDLDQCLASANSTLEDVSRDTRIMLPDLQRMLEDHGRYHFKLRVVKKVERYFLVRNVQIRKEKRRYPQ